MDFYNLKARFKGRTYLALPTLYYFNDHSEKALMLANSIFGLGYVEGTARTGLSAAVTTTVNVKAFNFTRQSVVQTGFGGFRSELKVIPYNLDYLDTARHPSARRNQGLLRDHEDPDPIYTFSYGDLHAAYKLMRACNVNPNGHVIIVQYKRIVGSTKQDLANSIRSMSANEEMIRNIELDYCNTYNRGNGEVGYYRDILLVTMISENTLNEHPAVLEVHSGVQLSFIDVASAPAYYLEQSPEMVSPGAGDDIRERKASVASYVLYYDHIERPTVYMRDNGTIVAIPQLFSTEKKPGFYKTWYEYHNGILRDQHTFIPMERVTPANGFFHTRHEAQYYAPEEEIKEFKDNIAKLLSKFSTTLNDITATLSREYSNSLRRTIEETAKTVREDLKINKKLHEQLEEARRARETDRAEFNRRYEKLQAELERSKNDTNQISNAIRLLTTVVTSAMSVITLFKPKKKPA